MSCIEKLMENTLAYKDYLRQGLVNFNVSSDEYLSLNEDENEFRVCTLNISYQLSKSLPSVFLVPRHTSDECVKKNSKCHRQCRLPILVWRHPKLKSVILRSSGFHGKGFIGMLIKTSNNNTQQDKEHVPSNASMEQDKYINEIIKLTRPKLGADANPAFCFPSASNNNNNPANSNCVANASSCMKNNLAIGEAAFPATPTTNRRSLFASKFEKAVQTIKNNYQTNGTVPKPASANNSSNSNSNFNI